MFSSRRTLLVFLSMATLLCWVDVASAQHDPGRDAMRMIASGKLGEARERLVKPPRSQNSPIDEAERHYVLAIADCMQGKRDAAIQNLKQAVQAGLPIERVLAGPRDLFEPLSGDSGYRTWLAAKSKDLLHGPMLSDLSDTTAEFWVRTAKESQISVKLFPSDPGQSTLIGTASRKTDFTAVVGVRGLKPQTRYRYQLVVDGKESDIGGEFETFPSNDSPSSITIGFGGGAGFTPQFHHMWQTTARQELNAFLMLGDNVYIDDPEHPMTQQYCYYRRQSEPLWKAFISSTPIYTIYDDHDFGMNDCIPGPDIDQPKWKRSVWNVFRQNWNNPGYGGGDQQPGCWYDFAIGDVHFFMLDGRYYRDLKGGSMLGPVQKNWLFEKLEASPHQFKVLASPVPWSPGVKPGSKDTWDGFQEEREEIFSFIHRKKINGVVLMAADRHRSDLRTIPREDGYDFYEVMSSRLTNVHTHGLVQNAKGSRFIMGYNEKCSFGRVTFDANPQDPGITYAIINIEGQEVGRHRIGYIEISDGKQTDQ